MNIQEVFIKFRILITLQDIEGEVRVCVVPHVMHIKHITVSDIVLYTWLQVYIHSCLRIAIASLISISERAWQINKIGSNICACLSISCHI